MVDSMIPEDRNTKDLQDVIDQRSREKLLYPDLLESAEKVNVEQQDFLVKSRRAFKQGDLAKGMIYATGEEVTTFSINGMHMPMLKMRVEENNSAVYVPLPEMGANYRHSASYIGQRKKIVLGEFVEAGTDDLGNPLYIAYASIKMVENTLGGIIYKQFQDDPDAVKNQDRIGIITEVVATDNMNMIFFDYQGISLTMLERDYHYRSYLHPLVEDAHVGDKIKFKITNITKDDYTDMASVREDREAGKVTPEGERYYIETSRLSYLPSPDEKVRELAEHQSYFLGRVVNWNPIKGVIVEIAPGYWLKGFITPGSHINFSMNDVIHHTKVVVVINRINMKTRSGQVYIRSCPDGVAPTTPDMDYDNQLLQQNGQQQDRSANTNKPVVEDEDEDENSAQTATSGEPTKSEVATDEDQKKDDQD